MDCRSLRGQVLIETLVTIIMFLSLTGFLWTHLNSHQKRVRKHYPHHLVKNGNKQNDQKNKRNNSSSTKTLLGAD